MNPVDEHNRIFELQERILELRHELRFKDIRGVEIRKEVLVSMPKSFTDEKFYDNIPEGSKPVRNWSDYESIRKYNYFAYIEPGFYEKGRFLDILRKHGFDIGHIIFQGDKVMLQLIDINAGLV